MITSPRGKLLIKNHQKIFLISLAFLLTSFTVFLASQIQRPHQGPPIQAASRNPVRGQPGDLWADVVIGQPDFQEKGWRERVAYKAFNPGGVTIDTTKTPDVLYVSDNNNNRILVYKSLGTCRNNSSVKCTSDAECPNSSCILSVNKPADMIIGQPNVLKSSCNNNGGYETYPDRAPSSSTTLCGIPERLISQTEGGATVSFDTDANGNLYFPDYVNNRVLLYVNPTESDAVADDVWGQADFSQNNCNRSASPIGNEYVNPTASTLCFGFNDTYNNGYVIGLDIDPDGNLWVADSKNHRVLRFPYSASTGRPSKTADVVLGQNNFTSGIDPVSVLCPGITDPNACKINRNNNNQRIRFPGAVAVRKVNNQYYVYVAETDAAEAYNVDYRIMVFVSDTSGQFVKDSQGFVVGQRWAPNFHFALPTGIRLDPAGRGLWISSKKLGWQGDKIELINFAGDQRLKILYKDINENDGICNSPVGVCVQHDSRSSIGFTQSGDLFAAATAENQDVVRFKAPIPDPQAGVLVPADYRLFAPPEGRNLLTGRSFTSPRGLAFAEFNGNKQLLVSDEKRILFWNGDANSLTNFQQATGAIGASTTSGENPNVYGRIKADKAGHLYVVHNNGIRSAIEIFDLPITHNEQPVQIISSPLRDLEGNIIDFNLYGDLITGGIYPSPDGNYLWVAHEYTHRVFRIRNPRTNPLVDVVLGQVNASGTSCNRGTGEANPNAPSNYLCNPSAVALDRQGNVYVSDYALEADGNGRLLRFNASRFQNINSTLYGPSADKVYNDNAFSSDHGREDPRVSPQEPAFDATNRMVVGFNPYTHAAANHSVDFFNNPLTQNTWTGSFEDYFIIPYAMDFDSFGNLYIADLNQSKVLIYKNPFAVTPTPTRLPTPTPTPPTSLNTVPNFITRHLKTGLVGKAYESAVKATDADGDELRMQITNLPPGLKQSDCKFSLDKDGSSRLDCKIKGLPLHAGIFQPIAVVTDAHKSRSTKTFRLIILPTLGNR